MVESYIIQIGNWNRVLECQGFEGSITVSWPWGVVNVSQAEVHLETRRKELQGSCR